VVWAVVRVEAWMYSKLRGLWLWLVDVCTVDNCFKCRRRARRAGRGVKANPILKRRYFDGLNWRDICKECLDATQVKPRRH
jgi:hypothetical protein